MFMGVGLVHYFNGVLNRLNALEHVRITNVVPSAGRGHLQEGVYQTLDNVDFAVEQCREYHIPPLYHSFRGLPELIRRAKPDIIVTTKFYLLPFMFDPRVRFAVTSGGVKIILKSIPFRVRPYPQQLASIMRGNTPISSASRLGEVISGLPWLVTGLRRLELELNRRMFRFPDAHVNYVEAARDIFGSYGVSREKVFVTYNSPDTDLLFRFRSRLEPEIQPSPAAPRMVHVGRLVPWKRVDLLLNAFGRVLASFPEATLTILGEGPEKQNLIHLADRLRISGSVSFPGGVYHPEQLGRHLLASDIYVLAGMGGLSINDAMAFGLPIICSECDGTEKHLVKDGINGLYFRPGDESDLADKMTMLLRDPERRQRMGADSTRIIQNEINIHTVVAGYRAAFDHVMGMWRQ